jgi:uncharacterized protein (TIGR02145 family)
VAILFLCSCEKDEAPVTVADIDGNIYKTTTIGSQVWMAENLRVTRLNDGTPVKPVENNREWQHAAAPAYSWYSNDSTLFAGYGALYNGYTVETEKLCPQGWRVPGIDDVQNLIATLGDTLTAGGIMKNTEWHQPNEGAGASSPFSAQPAGIRYFEGTFSSAGYFTGYWTSTQTAADTAACITLSYIDARASHSNITKSTGLSIRCIKNQQ